MEHKRLFAFFTFFIFWFAGIGCGLDVLGTGEAFETAPPDDVMVQDAGQDTSIDAVWPEGSSDALSEDGSVPDADAQPDAPEDVLADTPVDVLQDVVADTPEDIVTDTPQDAVADTPIDVPTDIPVDAPEDVVADAPEDVLVDAPEDVVADAPPTICETYGEDGVLMIYTSVQTSQSLVIKGTVDFPATSSEPDIPWKYFCWSPMGNGTMTCFPCPGTDACYQPDANYPRVPAVAGSIVDFQPWRAEGPYEVPQNTLCVQGICNFGLMVLCAGYTEVCRVDKGVPTGSASFLGTGTNAYVHCPM